MGHSSIQVTVDIYGHLIPGANASFVDRLDEKPKSHQTSPQQSATPAQPRPQAEVEISSPVVDLIGGGGRTRTYDLRIMRPFPSTGGHSEARGRMSVDVLLNPLVFTQLGLNI